MSRTKVCLLILIVLLLGVTSAPLAAQDDTAYISDCTVAQPGDSFWRISDQRLTSDQWEVLWKKNPTTPDGKTRKFRIDPKTGLPYVYLGVGELICGLSEAGVTPTIATQEELMKTGFLKTVTETKEVTPQWLWWLLAALAIALLYVAFRAYTNSQKLEEIKGMREHERREAERIVREAAELRRDVNRRREPEQLGTPIVPGGIRPIETERLQNFFHEAAVNAYLARHPELGGNRDAVRPTLIGRVEHGMLSGEGQVGDIYGNWHESNIDAPGRPGYQARFRYPDGTEELMQSYEACMNPVRRGEGMRGFTFVPNTQPAPAPQPEPVPQTEPALVQSEPAPTVQTAIVPEPAPMATTEAPAPVTEHAKPRRTNPVPDDKDATFFAFIPSSGDGDPEMMRWKGITPVSFQETDDGVGTFRYRRTIK